MLDFLTKRETNLRRMTGLMIFGGALLLFGCNFRCTKAEEDNIEFMGKEEREALKEEARDMFYHAYNAYMDNAYPADELMPLSCKGRYRGSEPNRGDIDSTLGNFSLTLVDTLDTLVVLGDFEEFENAVKLVIRDVTFDTDVIVSLFETNIRMLGGLLSGHILAEYLQQRAEIMPWYRGELLNLAKDLGYRFLPAFNTTTGIPYGRINLRHGMKGVPLEVSRETCTACAGSMILEMAALSRLTGELIFEEKAQKAMDVLWRMRHRGTDLMGSVLNVHSGDWVRRDSGVGAGIDSYYEYCLKAYILLGDEKYLGRFNRHYQAVMKYVSQGPMLLDVHMHRPNTNAKNFMDALLAFWPGLQVLKGDIKPAVETHEMLYQVMQRHNFIPEAFTTDFQVHWGHHPLRPEFLESTYFLYRATGDHYYLGVGRKVLKSLQTYARVPCGYAAVSDVRTNKHDDTMDSFVLSETLKYLFLLFAEPSELILDLDEFIFTTEGHLLPLSLASVRTNASIDFEREVVQVEELDRTCPNSLHLFPASVRQPLRNMVEDVCPRRNFKRRLSASQFQANNLEHLKMLSEMGITILTLADGRVQFLHTFSNAKSAHDAEEGLIFMQEMIELSKMQSQQSETRPQSVVFTKPGSDPPQEVTLLAGPAHFSPELRGPTKITGKVIFANPLAACSDFINEDKLKGMIVIVNRGSCMFVEKARKIQKAGALAGIVLDNVPGSSAVTSPMFAMSGDGKEVDDVQIPFVFLFSIEANELLQAIRSSGLLTVTISDFAQKDEVHLKAPTDQSMFERLKGSLNEFLSRQIMPQNLLSGAPPPAQEDLDLVEEETPLGEFGHLQAIVTKGSPHHEIRITAKPGVPFTPTKISESKSFLERQWKNLKQLFVNEIYAPGRQNSGVQVKITFLKSQFETMMLERGMKIEAINNSSLLVKVLWFLKELSELTPEKTATIDELMGLSAAKLFSLKSANNHFKQQLEKLKSKKEEMDRLFKSLESGNIQIKDDSLFKKLMQDVVKGNEKGISEHFELLDRIFKFDSKEKSDSVDNTGVKEISESKEEPECKTESQNLSDFEYMILSEIEKTVNPGKEIQEKELKKNSKALEKVFELLKDFEKQNSKKNEESKKEEQKSKYSLDPLEDLKKPVWAIWESEDTENVQKSENSNNGFESEFEYQEEFERKERHIDEL